ncbi:MAG: TraR/DksA C4-type zinc finger protein [Myxococcota bacterium]|jgi:RNA polymerase-binding transcription factor DksA|nr:TraR/DksA C4-type zinc finger protein [Myxococcota bacterium]
MANQEDLKLEDVIAGLRAREVELARRVAAVGAEKRRAHGSLDPSFPEQATQRENDEVLDGLDEVERSELAAVRAAIRRAEEGAFGTCDACEEPIRPARLRADPAATLCIGCAEAAERAAARD